MIPNPDVWLVFTNGASDRANYRKFKLSVQRNDDYANMEEVLTRRLSEKNLKSWGVPDLLLIDGGKGQLEAGIKALQVYDLHIPIISIAKREEEVIVSAANSNVDLTVLDQYRNGELEGNGVFVERKGEYYTVNLHSGQTNASGHSKNLRGANTGLAKYTHVTKLFQRIRDESHRFAVSYHTVLKRTKQTASSLEDIPGIGPATRRQLIRKFGSLRGVSAAAESDIALLIGAKKAAVIYKNLHHEQSKL
jgi:excinuclease ABC subunit C